MTVCATMTTLRFLHQAAELADEVKVIVDVG